VYFQLGKFKNIYTGEVDGCWLRSHFIGVLFFTVLQHY
jgi:hypothetical protein